MKNLILSFLVLAFPYMPLMHAEGIFDATVHCDSSHNDEQGNKHSMKACIDIIDTVFTPAISTDTDFVGVFSDIPFSRYRLSSTAIFGVVRNLFFHTTDPPYIKSKDLVGIIKILS